MLRPFVLVGGRVFDRQDEAHLVFSTLNSSGLPCMDQTAPFEVLVVDEAAQSVEVSTIIPLRCALFNDGLFKIHSRDR